MGKAIPKCMSVIYVMQSMKKNQKIVFAQFVMKKR